MFPIGVFVCIELYWMLLCIAFFVAYYCMVQAAVMVCVC